MSINAHGIAGTTPRALLRRPDFWMRQPFFLVAVGLGVAMAIALAPFTYARAERFDLLFVLIVQALAVYAGAMAAKALATVEVERAIVEEIERKGSELLLDVRTNQRARIDLDHLEQSIVPINPAKPAPAMIRLFQHIVKEARDRKFESSVQVMQPYREEPLDDVFKLQNVQKIALWLGILGTFIGLLFAIDAADARGTDFMVIVRKMFTGLSMAFCASLAGLQVAVFAGVLLLLVRRAQEQYFKEMESAVVTMLSLARNSVNKDEFLAELGQVTGTIQDLTRMVHEQTREVGQNLQSTRADIQHQTGAIREGLEGLTGAREKFDGFLAGLGASQVQFIEEVRGVYDTISLHELSATLRASFGDAGRLMMETVNKGTHQIANRLGDFNGAVDRLSSTLELQSRESAENTKKVAALIHGSATETTKAIAAIVARVQEMAVREQSLRGDVQDLSRRIAMLSNTLEKLDRSAGSRTLSIRELLGSLRW